MSDTPASQPPDADADAADPGFLAVQKYLLYTLSLPERTLRSSVGLVGGALRESSSLLVPRAFRNSTTYSTMVQQMLNYLVEDVGGVAKTAAPDTPPAVENYVARKAVGNFVELAGMATMHLSPLTVLAVVSDVAYGSRTFLKELSQELKSEGVIDQKSSIDSLDDLLAAVGTASSTTAAAIDTPPLSVDGLRETIDSTRAALGAIDLTKTLPQAELERMWREMHELATRENVSLLQLSSAMTLYSLDRMRIVGRGALSSVRVAGNLLDEHVLEHYEEALNDIRREGIYAMLARTSRPYIAAVWSNYSAERGTVTEDLLTGRLLSRAKAVWSRWFGSPPASPPAIAEATGDIAPTGDDESPAEPPR